MTSDDTADNGLESRSVAYHMLCDVLIRKTPLDQVIARHEGFAALEGRDRGFTRMIVATALRRKGQLDDLIRRVQKNPKDNQMQTVPILLYVGIVQLLFMNVPDHAAVDTTVTIAENENMSRQKGFMNAALRRMITEGKEWLKKQDEVTTNIPNWLLQKWIADYDLKLAAEIAQASLIEAPTDVTPKDQMEQTYWASELDGAALPTGSVRLASAKNLTDLSGFEEGSWWVQDASAALPATLLGDLTGKTVVDLCAAPGGKTAQLAAAGAQVMAVDRSAKRLERLKENMERLKLTDKVDVIVGDGAAWRPSELVDAVLLDAPCSATGTLRRHPDVMHLKGDEDLERLCNIQNRLFNNAAEMIKPGGVLIYCTCSLQKDEGERQVEKFLERHEGFQRVPIKPEEVGGVEALITPEGDLRVLPFHLAPQGGMDGFYAARLVKN